MDAAVKQQLHFSKIQQVLSFSIKILENGFLQYNKISSSPHVMISNLTNLPQL